MARKGQDKDSGTHLMLAMSYEHSNTNINNEMKWKGSNLPVVRNEAVYAQPQVQKGIELRKRSIPRPEQRYRTMLNITRETYNLKVWNCRFNV
jgi:hypothetical protein